jgi:hypothetical protein
MEVRYGNAEHMRSAALGRVQAASALHREAGVLLTDSMRAFVRAGGTVEELEIETGFKLPVIRSVVKGKRTA